MNMEKKQFELNIGKVSVSIKDSLLIYKVELVLDHFNYTDKTDIFNIVQKSSTSILDSDVKEYKILEDSISLLKNNPEYDNEYEMAISFDMIEVAPENSITILDMADFIKSFKMKRIIIRG